MKSMKLSHWIRMHEAGTRAARPLILVLLGEAVLGIAALGSDVWKMCGSCGAGNPVHATIAAIGILGYLALVTLVRFKAWTSVYLGVFAAMGIHLALAAFMVASKTFCPICAAAAALSLAAPAALLFQDREEVRWIPRATVPAFLLSGLLTWTLLGAREARADQARAQAREAAHLLVEESTRSKVELHVFESAHCPYCREFRDSYAPRLAQDFPDLDVVYHPAAGVPWVQRTPTLVIGGNVTFEGLPVDYRDLALAVAQARGSVGFSQR
jgi:hypothetical protein